MRLPREFGKSEAGNQECKHRPGMTTIPKFPDFRAGGAGGGVLGFYPDPDAAPRALFPLLREGWRLRNTKTHSRPGFGIEICPSGYQGAAPSRSTWIPHSRSSGSAELRAPENWSKKKKVGSRIPASPTLAALKGKLIENKEFRDEFSMEFTPSRDTTGATSGTNLPGIPPGILHGSAWNGFPWMQKNPELFQAKFLLWRICRMPQTLGAPGPTSTPFN